MTTDQETLLMVRGAIASLPADMQTRVAEARVKLDAIRDEYGDAAHIAITLIGAELAAAAE
jgi:hypothetical protein